MEMTRYAAIFQRHSVRKYAAQALPAEELAAIRALVETEDRLQPALPLQVHLVEEGERIQRILSGVIGSYGKIRAPHYLVVTAAAQGEYLENIGYTLEGVVLTLTVRGIATCWIGGHIDPALLYNIVDIPAGHQPVLLIAAGHAAPDTPLYRADPASAKRKPLSELVLAGSPDDAWRRILEAVRIAPSAANSQPWRFLFAGDAVHIYQAHVNVLLRKMLSTINHVDMGIALRHIHEAAGALQLPLHFSRLPAPERSDAAYLTSVRS